MFVARSLRSLTFEVVRVGLTFGCSLGTIGCGDELPLSEQARAAGAGPVRDSSAGLEPTSEAAGSTFPGIAESGASDATTRPPTTSFLVPAAQAVAEVTQVYNGDTH